ICTSEIWSDANHSAIRIFGGGEVDRGRIGETVADTRADEVVARHDAINRAERQMAEESQERSSVAVRVIKQTVASADHRVSQRLVSEAKARRPVREVAVDTRASIYAIARGK